MPVARLLLFATVALALSCDHQYLSIPGARVVAGSANYSYDTMFVGTGVPTATIVQGSPDLTAGSSVVAHVDFCPIVDIEVTTLVFLEWDTLEGNMDGHWQYDLSDEEIAACAADVTITASLEPLSDEECGGVRRCSQEDDHGVTALGLVGADATQTSLPADVDVRLAPLPGGGGGGDACAPYTTADCCAGAPGIQAVECAWDPSLDCCPGDTVDGGFYGDGYRRCVCPA